METVIRPRSSFYLFHPAEWVRFRYFFVALCRRDLAIRYKQTVLGVLWVVLQPLLQVGIFTVLFARMGGNSADGLPFPVFVAIGVACWSYFSAIANSASSTFIVNEQLVKKVAFPREMLPAVAAVTASVDSLPGVVFFWILAVVLGPGLTFLSILASILGFCLTLCAGFGFGLFLSALNAKFRDVRYILPYFLQLGLFVTPIMYSIQTVPPIISKILLLNPMTGISEGIRLSFSGNIMQVGTYFLSSIVVISVLCLLGFYYFRKTERYLADIL